MPVVLTGCTLIPAPTAVELYAETRLASMTLTEKVSSLLMLYQPGTDTAALRSFVDTHDVGGLVLMGDNVPGSIEQLSTMTAALSADAGLPLLARAGIGVNFGIVADVPAVPGSFLYDRALGTTAESAAKRVAAAVAGESGRVKSTLKHFPGRGAAAGNSHVLVPSTDMAYEDWLAEVAPPFEAGNTMLLYVLPQNPAIEGIDIPVLVTALTAAVEDGRIDEELIDANARRVLELRRTLALADATSVNNE